MQLRLNCFHGVRRDKTNKHRIARKKHHKVLSFWLLFCLCWVFELIPVLLFAIAADSELFYASRFQWPSWSGSLSSPLLNLERVWNSADFWWGMPRLIQTVLPKLKAWSQRLTVLPVLLLKQGGWTAGNAEIESFQWGLCMLQMKSVCVTHKILAFCCAWPSVKPGSCNLWCSAKQTLPYWFRIRTAGSIQPDVGCDATGITNRFLVLHCAPSYCSANMNENEFLKLEATSNNFVSLKFRSCFQWCPSAEDTPKLI